MPKRINYAAPELLQDGDLIACTAKHGDIVTTVHGRIASTIRKGKERVFLAQDGQQIGHYTIGGRDNPRFTLLEKYRPVEAGLFDLAQYA